MPSEILWRGLPYSLILKMEKQELEVRMKDEIREELEIKRMNRGQSRLY